MGTTPLPSQDAKASQTHPTFDPSHLRKIEDCPPFTIWMDQQGRLYELYKIFTSRPLEEEISIYEFRKTEHSRLVNVIHYQIVNRQFDSSGYLQLQVFTERIPSTLSEIEQIPFANGLQVLLEALEGFQMIFKHSGPFDLDDSLIGFNTIGRVKVWINNNWSLNSKSISQKRRTSAANEHQFIHKLIQVVQKHMEISSLYVSWISSRKSVKEWTFTSLKTFIIGFIHNYNININYDHSPNPKNNQKSSIQQKQTIRKQCLNFKSKSNSPTIKYLHVTTSLANDRNILKPLLASKEANIDSAHDRFKVFKIDSEHCLPTSSVPAFLTFKNKSKNKNKSFKHSAFFKQKPQEVRVRRNSEQVGFSLKPIGKRDNRMPSNQGDPLQSGRSMMLSNTHSIKLSGINYTITVSDPNTVPTQKQTSSLQHIRKQLRNYLGTNGSQQGKFRASYTGTNSRKDVDLKESREFQFKNVNMKKKRKKEQCSKIQEPTRDSPQPNLRSFAKKAGSASRQKEIFNKYSPQPEVRSRVKSTTNVPNFGRLMDCKLSGLASQTMIQKNPKLKSSQFQLRLDNLKSRAQTRNANESMIANSFRPDASTITIQSNTKRVEQSILMPEHNSQQNDPQNPKSFKLGCLKGKSVMTQSINIPSSKSKVQPIIRRQDLRELKLLDQIVFKSNITKNKNSQDLDISLEISEGGQSKKSILQLEEECN